MLPAEPLSIIPDILSEIRAFFLKLIKTLYPAFQFFCAACFRKYPGDSVRDNLGKTSYPCCDDRLFKSESHLGYAALSRINIGQYRSVTVFKITLYLIIRNITVLNSDPVP